MITFTSYDQFILFGDSITEQSCTQERGFALTPALQEAYIRRLDVINRGFSGYNTTQALKILPHLLPTPDKAKIRLMTIFLGANDACIPEANNGQHVPLAEFKANLISIVTHSALKAHNAKLILVTPGPLEERRLEERSKTMGYEGLTRYNNITATYAQATREVGQELALPVLDLWNAFQKRAGWKEGEPFCGSKDAPENDVMKDLLHDGLHFAPLAYEVFFEELVKLIKTSLPDHVPEAISYAFPRWDDADEWAKEGLAVGRTDVVKHS